MTEKDLPAVQSIEQQSPSPWSMGQMEGELFATNGLRLVCTEEATGRVSGYLISRHIVGEAEILRLGVNFDDRKQGIASLLLATLMHKLSEKGVSRCHLELRSANNPARSLYEKFDFLVTGRRKNYYTDPQEDAVCMSKDVTANPSDI